MKLFLMATVRLGDIAYSPSVIYLLCYFIIDEAKLVSADDCICLQDIPKNKNIAVLLPHSDASAFHAIVRLRICCQVVLRTDLSFIIESRY